MNPIVIFCALQACMRFIDLICHRIICFKVYYIRVLFLCHSLEMRNYAKKEIAGSQIERPEPCRIWELYPDWPFVE
jgi:hypothetical protein